MEKAIIDYACTYSIPLSKGERNTSILRNTESDKAYIGEYANVFMERFRGQFGSGMYLNYECRISASCVMLRFIVEDIEKLKAMMSDLYRYQYQYGYSIILNQERDSVTVTCVEH